MHAYKFVETSLGLSGMKKALKNEPERNKLGLAQLSFLFVMAYYNPPNFKYS